MLAKLSGNVLRLNTMDISKSDLYGDSKDSPLMQQPQNASGSSYISVNVCLLLELSYGGNKAGKIPGSLIVA